MEITQWTSRCADECVNSGLSTHWNIFSHKRNEVLILGWMYLEHITQFHLFESGIGKRTERQKVN